MKKNIDDDDCYSIDHYYIETKSNTKKSLIIWKTPKDKIQQNTTGE